MECQNRISKNKAFPKTHPIGNTESKKRENKALKKNQTNSERKPNGKKAENQNLF